MAITDELRKWAEGDTLRAGMSLRTARDQALAIADRIDAEHESKVSYWQGASYKDGYDEGFASADDWLAQHEDAMAEHGWYRALDADKQPIKFGDQVEHNGVVANVLGITFHGTTPPTVCIVRGDCWVEADELRHHHVPTVEDVLREFAAEFVGIANHVDDHEVTDAIEMYAPKLRLAGDAE